MAEDTEVETPTEEVSTLEDLEREFGQPAGASDDAAIPEEFRALGKKDLYDMVQNTQAALKEAEKVRQEAETRRIAAEEAAKANASRPVTIHAPAPERVDPLDLVTEEQLDALHASDDPSERKKARQIELAINNKRLAQQFESRMGGMQSSAFDSSLQLARQKDPEAFELFEKEIMGLASTANPALLGSVGQWEQLIRLVKGSNVDTIISARAAKKAAAELAAAQNGAANGAPFTPRTAAVPAARRAEITASTEHSLDDETKRIARKQFAEGQRTPWGIVGKDITYADAYTRMANA